MPLWLPSRLLMSTYRAESTRPRPRGRPRPRPSPRGRASELPVPVLRLLSVVVNVGAEVTGIPRKEVAVKVEPSVVVRAYFVTPEAVEPTGTVMTAVMITEPATTWTTTKDGGDRRPRCLYCSGRNPGGREREERAWLEVTEAAARRDNLRRDETIVRSPVVAKWSPCCEHPVIKRVWRCGDGDQKKAQVVCEFARPRATSRRVWCEEGGCGSNVEACLEGLRGSLPTVIEFKRCAPIKCAHAWVRGCKKPSGSNEFRGSSSRLSRSTGTV